MRLRVWGHIHGEYLYFLTKSDIAMKYKTSSIAKKNDIES